MATGKQFSTYRVNFHDEVSGGYLFDVGLCFCPEEGSYIEFTNSASQLTTYKVERVIIEVAELTPPPPPTPPGGPSGPNQYTPYVKVLVSVVP